MSNQNKPAAIILAAGLSSRMKDFKPLMKIDKNNALEVLISNFQLAGVEDIYVVVGYNADIIEKYFEGSDINFVKNEDYEKGMFSSIQKGIAAASKNDHDCYLINPVDVPLIPPYIIEVALRRHEVKPDCFVMPCFECKHGHPILVPSCYAKEILSSNMDYNLKAIRDSHKSKIFCFDTHCSTILMDMDTPEAYNDIVIAYKNNQFPNEEQCFKIYDRCETPSHIIRHCIAVTNTALTMADALIEKGWDIDRRLVYAAGMLHDCLRTKNEHGRVAAELLMHYGYKRVADIVLNHMDYVPDLPIRTVDENDLVCLGDKLCQEDRLVTLEERMKPVRERFKGDKEVLDIVTSRISAAGAVLDFISESIGKDVYELLKETQRIADEKASYEPAKRRIILIRHGETQKHKDKIFMGQVDIPLNEEGKEQSTHVGLEMQHFNIDTDTVYCSDLKRAKESAKIITRILGDRYTVSEVPEFREMSLGSWDGKFIEEIKEKYPEAYEQRGKDITGFRIDDVAENFYDLSNRVVPKLRSLIASTEGDIVIVSHAGVIRAIRAYLAKKSVKDMLKLKIGRGTYEIIEYDENSLPEFVTA